VYLTLINLKHAKEIYHESTPVPSSGATGQAKLQKHEKYNLYSPQSRRDRRENYYFAFAGERPANANHHAFGKLLQLNPARRAWVYFFSLFSAKRNKKTPLCSLCL